MSAEANYVGRGYVRLKRKDALCVALAARYPGVSFNQVLICACNVDDARYHPERDLVEVSLNVSGTADALIRHGFARPDWFAELPRKSVMSPETKGFGNCYFTTRTAKGFRINGLELEDAFDRFAALIMPALLAPFRRKATASD